MRNIRIKVCLLKDIHEKNISEELSRFVFFAMQKEEILRDEHNRLGFKKYSMQGNLFTREKDNIYREAELYDFNIKCLNKDIADAFIRTLRNLENDSMLVVDVSSSKIDERKITKVYTVTPAVATLKNEQGQVISWMKDLGVEKIEKQIFNNMLKKYNAANNINLNISREDVIEKVVIKSNFPIKINYKNSKMFGYKYEVYFKDNVIAQEIARVVNVLGLLEKCSSLGAGFVMAVS